LIKQIAVSLGLSINMSLLSINSFKSRQFLFFMISGGVAAIVNFCSRIVYSFWFEFSVSVILAYVTGMLVAFILFRIFVFKKSSAALHRSAFFFVVVNLFAIAQTWLVSVGLAFYALPVLGVDVFVQEIAHAVGVVVPVFTSYLGHKRWSFRE
jgi:putative flippase GtrA